MQKTTSIQSFLNFGGARPSNPYSSSNFNNFSLISPMYERPKPDPQYNQLDMKKSPSLIKMESKSEVGQQETPLPLPMDTPIVPPRTKESPSVINPSLISSTPISKQTPISIKQEVTTKMLPPISQGLNPNDYNKTLVESGLDAELLHRGYNTDSTIRRADAEPKLQNIVSTVDMKCKLDLKTIALNARNTEYNPKRFAAAIMKIRNPKTTALIFSSGKMVCTGAKSEEDSKKAAKKYAKTIKNMGFDVRFTDFKVQNIVASADVGFAIRLESLSHKHAEFCQYEPEIFPGLIYRIYQPKVVVLIFVSGKIVLTGAKTREQIKEAYVNILPALQMHRKEESTLSRTSSVHSYPN